MKFSFGIMGEMCWVGRWSAWLEGSQIRYGPLISQILADLVIVGVCGLLPCASRLQSSSKEQQMFRVAGLRTPWWRNYSANEVFPRKYIEEIPEKFWITFFKPHGAKDQLFYSMDPECVWFLTRWIQNAPDLSLDWQILISYTFHCLNLDKGACRTLCFVIFVINFADLGMLLVIGL